MNYGVGVPRGAYTEGFLAGACPIVASYGARDRANRGTASRLGQVLEALGVDHDRQGVPRGRARVSQRSRKRGGRNPLIVIVMGKFAGPSGYHEPSARDAHRRIVSFFSTHPEVSCRTEPHPN